MLVNAKRKISKKLLKKRKNNTHVEKKNHGRLKKRHGKRFKIGFCDNIAIM